MTMSLLSCKAQTVEQASICGTFYESYKDKHFSTSYTLILNSDSTFSFHIIVKDGQPQCNGKWELVEDEFILLKCGEDANPFEMLSNHYMSQKEHKLQVLNKNKIKYKNVVLKRKK
jgi:hypothetical protein